MAEKKSFIIYKDTLTVLDELTDSEAGRLFKAIAAYQLGIECELDPITRVAFSSFKSQFIRDAEKYKNIVTRNQTNGKSGGRPPKQENSNKPSGFLEIQASPKKADSDSDSDSDSEKEKKGASIESLPEGLCLVSWEEWLAHRKKLKVKKYTTNNIAKQLAALPKNKQAECVKYSIDNNYQGLFPERFANENTKRNESNNIDWESTGWSVKPNSTII